MKLEELSPDGLRKLRPHVGEASQARIDQLLAAPPTGDVRTTPKSLDPRDRMNQTEGRYADILDARKGAGEIVKWWYEEITFRVGVERTIYRPDFVTLLPNGRLEVIEVKGAHVWDDARVKFQSAAREYPFARWSWMQWKNNEWKCVYDYAPNFY